MYIEPYHGLVDGVGGVVGEDAGGQAGEQLAHAAREARVQHVVVDGQVLSLREPA